MKMLTQIAALMLVAIVLIALLPAMLGYWLLTDDDTFRKRKWDA